jgi:hypothetical protein
MENHHVSAGARQRATTARTAHERKIGEARGFGEREVSQRVRRGGARAKAEGWGDPEVERSSPAASQPAYAAPKPPKREVNTRPKRAMAVLVRAMTQRMIERCERRLDSRVYK